MRRFAGTGVQLLVVDQAVAQYGVPMAEFPTGPDDLDLMARVRAGDAEAFTALVERHQHRVVGTIARMLGSPDEAEDLAQMVFIRVWKSAPRWEPSAKFTTWLLTITRNLVFNEVRRRGRARTVPLEEPDDFAPREFADSGAASPSDALATAELRDAIDAAIQSLAEQPRMALILRRYEEMPYEEIAAVLGVTVPAVKSMLFRARTELRSRLAAWIEESP
ncbi:MAG: sigma-70 family RNA polymerase sigma factor [Terrimicrobiaceae bacterium]|nr:sigma-70 family RNA polymerase sigma factor [Terrimicrobiaceae bacterium]